MPIISQETFEKFTEEEKEKVRTFCHTIDDGSLAGYTAYNAVRNLFGKENLQPNQIKTWKDVEKEYPDTAKGIAELRCEAACAIGINSEIVNKIIATCKIAKLIELGYGGVVSKEEWGDKDTYKWYIAIGIEGKLVIDSSYENWQEFISFHTKQQAEEFMSYPENVELVKQYYMI